MRNFLSSEKEENLNLLLSNNKNISSGAEKAFKMEI
jgi:hypothetical protein